jgi:hypothetical protein
VKPRSTKRTLTIPGKELLAEGRIDVIFLMGDSTDRQR